MEQMYLPEIEAHAGGDPWSDAIRQIRTAGAPVPQIMHLFADKPDRTEHLARFTQGVMRGPSPLGNRSLVDAVLATRPVSTTCPRRHTP